VCRVLLGFAFALLPATLLAHSLGESYGVLRAGPDAGTFTVTYNMRRDQFLQLADLRHAAEQTPLQTVAAAVRAHYRLISADGPCETTRFGATETDAFLQASFVARCPRGAVVELHNDAFFDVLPDHLHFVRVSSAGGSFLGERVMDRSSRSWMLPDVPASVPLAAVALRYAGLGVGHMALGLDHLAFLASVLLLVRGMKPLILAITGFTIGHSITLALAVLGLAVPNDRLVEALIGLTVALVAAEGVFHRQGRLGTYAAVVLASGAALTLWSALTRGPDPLTMAGITVFFAAHLALTRERPAWLPVLTPALTAFFGMIHGFGFAGSLLEIGLPVDQLALALLVFNLGIEFGQLLIIAALLLALALTREIVPAAATLAVPARHLLSLALVALGSFWFVDRAFV
jgi:hypothetical protein